MSVQVQIIDGPLAASEPFAWDGAGALLSFEGIVRPREEGRAIAGLDYEAYEPMASRMLDELARGALERFGLLAVRVAHSRGRVANGECSFRLQIASRHRKEGLAAMDWFIDAMKKDVPIWKTPVLVDAATEAIAR